MKKKLRPNSLPDYSNKKIQVFSDYIYIYICTVLKFITRNWDKIVVFISQMTCGIFAVRKLEIGILINIKAVFLPKNMLSLLLNS